MIHLETQRLLLRPVVAADLEHFAPMDADPEVMRYVADGRPRSREAAAAGVTRLVETWRDHGFGIFAARLRDTGEVIGWVGLAVPAFLPEVLPAVEIGWRLRREFWGAGYATEGARVALRWAFVERKLDRLISIRHPDNIASGRVMAKLGFTFERATTVPENGRPCVVYELTRDAYLRT
jgi:RimJ/RimL family protein N-acetyltransferase